MSSDKKCVSDVVAFSQSEEGRERARALILRHQHPVYVADPSDPSLILERLPNGRVRKGHFAQNKFIPVSEA